MNWQARLKMGMLCVLASMTLTGCRYMTNRYYDFRDTLDLGAGITAENSVSGIIPPSFGAHVQITDFLQLGWITHNGYSAETDMRGTFVGPESYTRAGFLWWQYFHKNQDYFNASYVNKFKDKDFLWCVRMESFLLGWDSKPAKRLHYEHWMPYPIEGVFLAHQGWQYWGYSGVNLAICEPFLTHLGVMLRLGIDPSEFSDFLLGWFGLDFKHDDMLPEEYAEFRKLPMPEPAPMAVPAQQAASQDQPSGPQPLPMEPQAGAPTQPPAGATPAEPMRRMEVQPFPEMEIIYFDYDRDVIRADQLPRIEKNLKYLIEHGDAIVQVVGHCDERGTTEYNYNLGLRRAGVVRDYLSKNGVAAERIQVLSRGEEEPANPGQNEAAWSANRRAEFKRVVVITATTMP